MRADEGGVVLALLSDSRYAVLLGLLRQGESDNRNPAAQCSATTVNRVASFKDARDALQAEGKGPLILDVTLLSSCPADWLTDLDEVRRRAAKVILFGMPSPRTLRAAIRLAKTCECELFVPGIDPLAELIALCSHARLTPHSPQLAQVVSALTCQPAAVGNALVSAVLDPENWSVKRVAAHAGVSRRLLERYCAKCGVESPGRLLRNAKRLVD